MAYLSAKVENEVAFTAFNWLTSHPVECAPHQNHVRRKAIPNNAPSSAACSLVVNCIPSQKRTTKTTIRGLLKGQDDVPNNPQTECQRTS